MIGRISVNMDACSGCHVCEMVCSLYHEKTVNLSKARCRIVDNYDELRYEPHVCQLCASPDCVDACAATALTQNLETGIITIDHDRCDQCTACVAACSHDAIWWNEELGKVLACDSCGGQFTCAQFCTSGALKVAGAAK